ncbi:ABC transporter ATP-binding protein [Williamsia deligens]|uniref:ABC transporter ATP-binding protein n=1 Tax=Williamsia deligens TaxID=321325 RepID=A0ABW3G422_9NOCA|nr:ABC transporter ATP-binding protein [Williamsia deligens]MCP2194286.1 iron complex transport system ATP-binding protein [Williamsia deligens]
MSRLTVHDLTVGYDDRVVLDGLSLDIPDDVVTTIVGPNGCGKSTLLRSMSRLLRPRAGVVRLDGTDIADRRPRDLAQVMGMLPQDPVAPSGLSVVELIERGRHPHQRWFRQASPEDDAAVDRAMELTGITDLADRPVDALSGGQRRRVWIALVLAQETEVLLLDEPTTFLDLAHAIDVLDLVRTLSSEHGKTVVTVLHDLNLAVRYSDHIVVMCDGAVLAQGPPDDVITPDLLESAFGLRSMVVRDPVTDGPLVVPLGR